MIKNFILKMVTLLMVYIPLNAIGLHYELFSSGYFTSIHVLTVDPKEHVIMPVKAYGESIARETVSMLSKRYGALAAVNGGFWEINGSPAGILKIDHDWYGTPTKPRGAIGWALNGQKVLIDRVMTNHSLDDFPNEGEIEVIPMSVPPHTSAEEWKKLEHIVGGTPVLVRSGNLIDDYSSEQTRQSFLVNKHPRTAVGIKESGEWVFVVVDGRFYEFFGGMTMKDLAKFMLELGCIEALNLDGGGSSTMVIEGEVVNKPCGTTYENGKRVTPVSDAILIFPISACASSP